MQHKPSLQRIRVWDLPTRVFHILLGLSVLGLLVTGELGGEAMQLHFLLGYTVLTLVFFRLAWGVVGGHWSRFAHFVPMPTQLIAYVRGMRKNSNQLNAGHNPLGAISVIVMLSLLLAQVFSGFMSDDEIANSGPWTALVPSSWVSFATEYHSEVGKVLLLLLIALHIATVLYYKYFHHDDLITPMLTGDKMLAQDTQDSRDTLTSRLFALSILAGSAYVVYRLVYLTSF